MGVTSQLGAGDRSAPAPHPDDDTPGPGFRIEDVTDGEQDSPAVLRAVRIEHAHIVRLDVRADEWQDCP